MMLAVASGPPQSPRVLDNALHRRIRRIFFGLYTSQLVLQVAVVSILEGAVSSVDLDKIVIGQQYIWLLVVILLLCLLILYQKRCPYPASLGVLSTYTAVQGVLLAELDHRATVPICLAFDISFLVTLVVMGAVSHGVASLLVVALVATAVNFGATLFRYPIFLGWIGTLLFFGLWVTYVASRISHKFTQYLKHNEPHRVMLYYTDIMLFVFFMFSLVFSCIAFEGCACCGASDDIPGVIDFRFPLDPSPATVLVLRPNAVQPDAGTAPDTAEVIARS
ncbi:hypothetical protein SPRG_13133 [Saprolegnia parasitica CBS 223.65]|uniref:Uncharacterized protein n=1 Tax=Saprolegnia parasitica (strain CBS 223.65) TaxID=695850 RepID=A0A067C4K5_SAPPC|nr:hypothetical protein SPRG_13133 [Saprolegnia parasitica CBS 223.65]KDO21717.1 hypothetical protein SPRG_13133 [Saprolegnia parasitica CBS 223.65]|eukprot:XP_012207520.1 hypothetical protein SPRG_13133 [Saprolegnia parasitica CBS 223.65]